MSHLIKAAQVLFFVNAAIWLARMLRPLIYDNQPSSFDILRQ